MRLRREKTFDRLIRAFAESVEELDFEAAEGWFATARMHVEPQATSQAPPRHFSKDQHRRARRSA
jgi:hypothetical protein